MNAKEKIGEAKDQCVSRFCSAYRFTCQETCVGADGVQNDRLHSDALHSELGLVPVDETARL